MLRVIKDGNMCQDTAYNRRKRKSISNINQNLEDYYMFFNLDQYTLQWREKQFIHAFTKKISTKVNTTDSDRIWTWHASFPFWTYIPLFYLHMCLCYIKIRFQVIYNPKILIIWTCLYIWIQIISIQMYEQMQIIFCWYIWMQIIKRNGWHFTWTQESQKLSFARMGREMSYEKS